LDTVAVVTPARRATSLRVAMGTATWCELASIDTFFDP
jgi:hypothetical protein